MYIYVCVCMYVCIYIILNMTYIIKIWYISYFNTLIHTYNTVWYILSHKEKWNYVIFRKTDRTGDHYVDQDKPNSKSQILYIFTNLWNLNSNWRWSWWDRNIKEIVSGYEYMQLCPPDFWQRHQKHTMEKTAYSTNVEKNWICMQKTETRSMSLTLNKYQLKVDQGL
jgi:hypothetical protein